MNLPFTQRSGLGVLSLLLCISSCLTAQTTGDLAFVGFNADGNDGFAFVTFVDIPANTDIWFTDEEWDGVSAFTSLTSEGDVVWSNSAITAAGTVIDIDGLSSTPVASLGTVVPGSNGGAGLSSSAEGIYVYLGTERAPTTFLTAITNDTWGGSAGALGGTGLTAGVDAIEFGTGVDVAAYIGPKLGQSTYPAYATGIYDLVNNWIYDDGSGDQSNDGNAPDIPFDITPFALGTSDLTPPIPTSAIVTSSTTILIEFNEPLDATSAALITNYTLSPIITISSAVLLNTDSVELTVAALADGVSYQLSVDAVKDTANNAMTVPVLFELIYNSSIPDLVITEILYNNPGTDSLEFLEIYNNSLTTAEVGGLFFSEGIDFTFPELSLPAGSTVLVAVDTVSANSFFGVTFPYQFGGALSNGGESLLLVNSLGDTIDQVIYDDATPWPVGPPSPDGDGPSIELINPALDNAIGSNWFGSQTLAGTDGAGIDIFATPGTVTMLTATAVSITEPTQSVLEDTGSMDIYVELNGLANDTVKVKLALTTLSTAESGTDFILVDTTEITFVPGILGQTDTISVVIQDDTDPETDEYFSVRLVEVSNADIAGAGTQLVYIRDNDKVAPVATEAISLSLLTSYSNTPATGTNSAEIIAFDPTSERMFIANSTNNSLDIVDMSDATAPVAISSIDMSAIGDLTSVAIFDTLVAVSAANPTSEQLDGSITFFDTTGVQLAQVTTGALPDMVTFTLDGQKVLVANEGQPSDDYTDDPEGSISIIDVSAGVATLSQADVTTADFAAFNTQQAALEADGVRISGLSTTTVAEDMEPEFITVSEDNLTAWVACQENNAIAVVDLMTNSISAVYGMGTKDWSMTIGLDAENESDEINIASYPFKGFYMPDAIASYEVAGVPYVVSANEGDAREYSALVDESRLGDSDYELDSLTFLNGDILKSAVGRIKTINTSGDTDGDGDFDEIYTLGGRSFSIWNGATGDLVYDSGDDLELIIAQDSVFGSIFNSNDDGTSAKNRSDDKGPEPEGVALGQINGNTYAFIGLERVGGVMVYDISEPTMPVFVQYVNTKLSNNDFAPEGLIFIPSAESPSNKPLLLVANEVSSTVSVFEISGEITGEIEFSEPVTSVSEGGSTIDVEIVLENGTAEFTASVDVVLGTFATADAGTDFTAAASQTVSFAPGTTSSLVSFQITEDSDEENDEYFSLRLENPVNAFLGSDTAQVVYILDNDRVADTGNNVISLAHVTSVDIGIAGDDAAEIVDYDPASETLVVANSERNQIELVDFSDPTNPVVGTAIDVSSIGGINSVAVYDGTIAAAIENDDAQLDGTIAFYDMAGNLLSQVTAGALPDMITFTPDGTKVLSANEGEPSDDYSVDPEGSVTIVDVSGGAANVTQADVSSVSFTGFNSQQAQLIADGVRIFGPNATVAMDLEPEFIALSANGDTAWVSCQENNALVVVDVPSATALSVVALGYKDHSVPGAGLDAEDQSDEVRIANYPIKGMYMPDAIASYTLDGTTYLVSANEGDAREYDTFEEESRLSGVDLDETAFPNTELLQESIGRLTITTATGDTDNDGDLDEIYSFGGRSFSIWNGSTGNLLYDSGDDMELYLSQDSTWGPFFNSTDDELELKNRSDNKGPEPEAVVIGNINGGFFAFVGLERIGGVMVYDITDPAAPVFVDYANTRDTASDGGDLAPEGLVLIPNDDSPDGKYYLVVSNEVSSTLTVYEVDGVSVSVEDDLATLPLRVYPNPATEGVVIELVKASHATSTVTLYSINGEEVLTQEIVPGVGTTTLALDGIPSGAYLIEVMSNNQRAIQQLIVR